MIQISLPDPLMDLGTSPAMQQETRGSLLPLRFLSSFDLRLDLV